MATFNSPSDSSFKPKDMELIFSETLTSDANSIDTGTLPTGYMAYQIYLRARSDTAATSMGQVAVFFNGDEVAGNYRIFRVFGFNGTTPKATSVVGNAAGYTFVPSGTGDSHFFCGSSMQVYQPESVTGYKSFTMTMGSHSTNTAVSFDRTTQTLSGVWRNQSAITSIKFKCFRDSQANVTTADMVAGSSVRVYGLK